jgi:hypothetical protein
MPAPLPPVDQEVVDRMRAAGIVVPARALRAARAAKLELATACGVLMQETNGGRNVYGHDPTIFVGAGVVTPENYAEYKRQRDGLGPAHRRMQGVGPVQLTWWETQDEADAEGGCWDPETNMRVGFRHIAAAISQHGLFEGLRAYNGAGLGAERYATQVLDKRLTFREAGL